jgi:type III restriction enzyme
LDVEPKMLRLKQWCEDAAVGVTDTAYDFVFVDTESFVKYSPKTMREVLEAFTRFK